MKIKIPIILLIFCHLILFGQSDSIYNDDPNQYLPVGMENAEYLYYSDTGLNVIENIKIEPPFWWKGMKNTQLQILLYDLDINGFDVSLENANGIKLLNVKKVPNPNYLFIDVDITDESKTGFIDIVLTKGKSIKKYKYEIKTRQSFTMKGLDNSDFIYHIMPDRFSNGDPSNDSFDDMKQSGINRNKMYFRHGGDLQGVINNLDYLNELGVSALWMTPVLENDQPYASYHGYAITDFYNVDKRFGNNALYKEFVKKCHNKGIKVIKDIVLNHCGNENWLMKDIPSNNWIHQWPEFTKSNFRSSIIPDPYASDYDKKRLSDGWFDYSMPDLNQSDPLLATYLIQNNIWWIEYSQLDAYRIDTWYFPNQDFLSVWVDKMLTEYPNLTLFGETWVQNESVQAYFTKNNKSGSNKMFNLPSITDFQLNFGITDALTKPQTWTEGLSRLYFALCQDFLYDNPFNNIIFLDNHDKSRIFSKVEEDANKLKSAIGLLLTLRGIPSMYYGTELMFDGDCKPDGNVRQDFPGGWKEDKLTKFDSSGRTIEENEVFNYVKILSNYRKNTTALQTGKLKHFMPENGVYVYFRYDNEKTVMIVLNTNDNEINLDTKIYDEMLFDFSSAKNVITNKSLIDLSKLTISKNSILILELIK